MSGRSPRSSRLQWRLLLCQGFLQEAIVFSDGDLADARQAGDLGLRQRHPQLLRGQIERPCRNADGRVRLEDLRVFDLRYEAERALSDPRIEADLRPEPGHEVLRATGPPEHAQFAAHDL